MLRIQAEALTYDDVSLVPAHSDVLPKDVSLATQLTKSLRLNLPIVSAAMDTVTEFRLAVAMAQLGGIGILHKNMSAERQAEEVAREARLQADVFRQDDGVGGDERDVVVSQCFSLDAEHRQSRGSWGSASL